MATYRSLEDAASALLQYVGSNWTETPIAWENAPQVDFTDPGRAALDTGQSPYIEVTLHELPRVPVEVGAANDGVIRQYGYIQVIVNVRKDRGVADRVQIYDALQVLLEFASVSFVRVRDMMPRGTTYVNEWAKSLILFNFDYESARNG